MVRHRASNLGISIVYQGYKEKLQAFNDILGKKALRAEEVALVGRYAISIRWSDGHGTGIYSFQQLREWCQCPECQKNVKREE